MGKPSKVIKIFNVQESKGKVGGGWSFIDNLHNSAQNNFLHFVDEPSEADVMFIPSATMVTRKYVRSLKDTYPDKPFILRVDNLPPDHRNSGKGWARLRDDYIMADHIIYQSEWAMDHINPQLEQATACDRPNTIVYNGVDHKLFTPEGEKFEWAEGQEPILLFFLSSSDPAKRIEEVVHIYRELWVKNKKALLVFAGQGYTREWADHNFEFHNGENFLFLNRTIVDRQEVAKLYRSCDVLVFPAYGNACSNTVLEAMASGLGVMYQPYGGQHELVMPYGEPLNYVYKDYPTAVDRSHAMAVRASLRDKVEASFTLDIMTQGYRKVFEKALNGE